MSPSPLGALYELAVPSVVHIQCDRLGAGTGFVVDQGIVVTSNHVLSSGHPRISFRGGRDEVGQVIARDADSDLALVAVETGDRYPLLISPSARLQVGEIVCAIGHPLGLENAMSAGILSRSPGPERSPMFQLDLPLAPGNSGGPIMVATGGVVGVAAMISGFRIAWAVRSERIDRLLHSIKREVA